MKKYSREKYSLTMFNRLVNQPLIQARELLPWEVYLKGFCIGFLIFGSIVVLLVLITMGISTGHALTHEFDHGLNHDITTEVNVDKDLTIDKDLSIDKGLPFERELTFDKELSVDKDLTIDKDVSITHELSLGEVDHLHGPMVVDKSGSAPLLLLIAIFSITFGGLGLLLFWQQPEMNPFARLATILITPILLSIIVDLLWRKIAVSETYRLPTNQEFIGKEAVVMVEVDAEGGTIRVELSDQLEPLRVPAKAVHKHQKFLKDELVFIVGIDKNFYLVDNSRDLLEGKSKLQLSEPEENGDQE